MAQQRHYRLVVFVPDHTWDEQPLLEAEADGWEMVNWHLLSDTESAGRVRFFFLYSKVY